MWVKLGHKRRVGVEQGELETRWTLCTQTRRMTYLVPMDASQSADDHDEEFGRELALEVIQDAPSRILVASMSLGDDQQCHGTEKEAKCHHA